MSNRPIVLVAASGLAREVISVVAATGGRVEAILDDDQRMIGRVVNGVEVVGSVSAATALPDCAFLICVGSGHIRARIVDRLSALGVGADRYATIVHPSVVVPSGCQVGAGSILLAQVVMTADVCLGHHVVAMPHVVFTHDCVVADFATICAGVVMGGSVRIGRAAYLGMNSSVRQNVAIGEGATLGMGAVLLRDIPAGQIWVGIPAVALNKPATSSSDS